MAGEKRQGRVSTRILFFIALKFVKVFPIVSNPHSALLNIKLISFLNTLPRILALKGL